MYLRIFSFILIIVSVFFLPLPFALGLFIIMVSVFTNYFEGIIAGVFFDSVYYSPLLLETFSVGFFTVSFLFLIFFVNKFRKLLSQKSMVSTLTFVSLGSIYFLVLFFVINNVF